MDVCSSSPKLWEVLVRKDYTIHYSVLYGSQVVCASIT